MELGICKLLANYFPSICAAVLPGQVLAYVLWALNYLVYRGGTNVYLLVTDEWISYTEVCGSRGLFRPEGQNWGPGLSVGSCMMEGWRSILTWLGWGVS